MAYAIGLFARPVAAPGSQSAKVFPQAGLALWTYLHLRLPPEGLPFNALQQLVYAVVVFALAPMQIATELALSP